MALGWEGCAKGLGWEGCAKGFLDEMLVRPIRRHRKAVRENARIRVTERLEARHLGRLRGFADRREMTSSFPNTG